MFRAFIIAALALTGVNAFAVSNLTGTYVVNETCQAPTGRIEFLNLVAIKGQSIEIDSDGQVLMVENSSRDRGYLPLSNDVNLQGVSENYMDKMKIELTEDSYLMTSKGWEMQTCETALGFKVPCVFRWDDGLGLNLTQDGYLAISWKAEGQQGRCSLKKVSN